MKAAGKDCTSGAVSLLGFSAIFSAILLAQESIYGQMVAYMKESGEGTLERICSWALFSSLFGSGLLGRNPVNMHYHWLLSSNGES
ncbi:hypothetical protein Syun_020665 [Stephania yunnanensis]|uniref:Uncharacterized protein n=1 Tax=Stephania yunnanensis TaxID=152371 RepID=A0AAP0IF11_9MAGN